MYTAITTTFVSIFQYLEAQNILNAENESDLFCLHYVFIPRINASLEGFRRAWNYHPLSTEGNFSPIQLYTSGSLGSDLFDEDIDLVLFGHDPEAPTPDEGEESSVGVPSTDIPLSPRSIQILRDSINPLQPCQDNGFQLYIDTVQTVYELMQSDNLL